MDTMTDEQRRARHRAMCDGAALLREAARLEEEAARLRVRAAAVLPHDESRSALRQLMLGVRADLVADGLDFQRLREEGAR